MSNLNSTKPEKTLEELSEEELNKELKKFVKRSNRSLFATMCGAHWSIFAPMYYGHFHPEAFQQIGSEKWCLFWGTELICISVFLAGMGLYYKYNKKYKEVKGHIDMYNKRE